ncbi:MAG: tRNA (adenosine(37)-N6)-threonylcarbamoyltransferase complex dimerization subunit type 1 TsaB [Alistipes sp.]|nr:tRNA (adenosine(37)-N6)-threonylcarbamoyltransferase complex dimerization subunit type 1 TsaB [Alistipes sp.]
MATILCIETGTDICSVGIARDGEIVSMLESDEGRDHARKVGVFVDEILRSTGISPEDIDAVAVGKGPGSYTGLRIGVSFAKGLCYGLQKPLIAVGSLDALVAVAREDFEAGIVDIENWSQARLCPMVDARRMEVYAEVFDSEGSPLSDVVAEVVTAESFAAWRRGGAESLGGEFVIFGNGAAKCVDVLGDATLINVTPSVRGIAPLAQKAYDEGRFEDIAYFEPFYLKDFVVTTSKKRLF